MKQKVVACLLQGVSPRRLALTLALGFAIGCIPVIGVTTLLCFAAAFALRLNLPAIQAANWTAMPLQVALIVPFVRMGRLFGFGSSHAVAAGALLHRSPMAILMQMGSLTGQAILAWLVIAIPAVALITVTLTAVLRRIPVVASARSAD
jgi:uncharacterized protein (DUF2062 family)